MSGATTEPTQPPIGRDGEPCASCGGPLAADQRYCLNCGQRRAGIAAPNELLDAQAGADGTRSEAATPPAVAAPAGSPAAAPRDVSPIAAVGGIAILGVMLLLGVLIGRGGGESNASAPPPVVEVGEQTTTPEETATTEPEVTTPEVTEVPTDEEPNANGGGGEGGGSSADDGARGGTVEEPAGISPEDLQALESATGDDFPEAPEDLPDSITPPGEAPPTDDVPPGAGAEQPQTIK